MLFRYNSEKEIDIQPEEGLEQFFWNEMFSAYQAGKVLIKRIRVTENKEGEFKEGHMYRIIRL